MSFTIGIDPGQKGALAALYGTGKIAMLHDLPVIRDKSLAWIDGNELQSMLLSLPRAKPAIAFVERVSSMPGQGVASSFQFGVGFGSILSIIQAARIRLELVTPGVWKKSYGITREKDASLHRARLLFPDAELHLAKHDGRAEALLIADYGRRLSL